MILDIKVKNFLSFKNETNFTMRAGSDTNHEESLIISDKERISKVRTMYGANASGKTSFLYAIDFIQAFCFMSNRLISSDKIQVQPFKFRENFLNIPSEFSISFIFNSIKYVYSFSCTRDRVVDESLDIYYSSKPTKIFKRTDTNHYEFNNKDEKLLNKLREMNTENKLFLVTSATWNYDKTQPVVDYILNKIIVQFDKNYQKAYLEEIIDNNELEDFKYFCLKVLNNGDISIDNFVINSKKVKDLNNETPDVYKKLINKIDQSRIEEFNNQRIIDIRTYHKIKSENDKLYELSMNEESLGTKCLFNLAPILYRVFKDGAALFLDEIDRLCVNRENLNEISELKRTLIELMQFLDEIKYSPRKMVIGCTNIIAQLDEALIRRFSIQEEISKPTMEEKIKFVELCLKKVGCKINNTISAPKFLESYQTMDAIKKDFRDAILSGKIGEFKNKFI